MADLVKKESKVPTLWDPFAAMKEMLRWDPFREMVPQFSKFEPAFVANFEVRENPESFLFRADVPGIKKENLEIQLIGNRLQISGKREEEKEVKNETIYTYERSYGNFTRVFTLPEEIDGEHVRTDLKDGVLTVVVPKKLSAQPKRIPISTPETKA